MAGRSDRTTLLDRARLSPGRGTSLDPSGRRTGESAVILDYMDRRRRKASVQAGDDGLVAEIVEALLSLGGTAHRDMVARQVALARGGGGEAPPEALKTRLEAVFAARMRLDRAAPNGAAAFNNSPRVAAGIFSQVCLRMTTAPTSGLQRCVAR